MIRWRKGEVGWVGWFCVGLVGDGRVVGGIVGVMSYQKIWFEW